MKTLLFIAAFVTSHTLLAQVETSTDEFTGEVTKTTKWEKIHRGFSDVTAVKLAHSQNGCVVAVDYMGDTRQLTVMKGDKLMFKLADGTLITGTARRMFTSERGRNVSGLLPFGSNENIYIEYTFTKSDIELLALHGSSKLRIYFNEEHRDIDISKSTERLQQLAKLIQ